MIRMKLQKKNSRHFIKSLKNIDLKMTKTLLSRQFCFCINSTIIAILYYFFSHLPSISDRYVTLHHPDL